MAQIRGFGGHSMSYYEIQGGRPLSGRLTVQGAKNSVPAHPGRGAVGPGGERDPQLPRSVRRVRHSDILRLLGCRVERQGDTVAVDATAPGRTGIPEHLMREMRSSGSSPRGRCWPGMGEVELSYPGGCELGPPAHRPAPGGVARTLGARSWRSRAPFWPGGAGAAWRGGRSACPSPAWGPPRTPCLAACSCPGTTAIVGAAR